MKLSFWEIDNVNFFSLSPSKTNILLKASFRTSILSWYHRHKRDLPWRKSNDPYVIWLSEIILQQTRVDQGLPYFNKFLKNYPAVEDLANANEDQVMKDWEGLGYYSRARNLHYTAKYVSEELNGEFPSNYEDLLKLKGIGGYTAAAISSFSSNEARAVLDGNVFRVLSRYLGVSTPINTTKGKKEFEALADEMLDRKNPADYNQAIMEFGAIQCVPKNPDCNNCILSESCAALLHDKVGELPVKEKKKYDRHRFFTFLIMTSGNKLAVQQREANDVWRKLYQFPMIEESRLLEPNEVVAQMSGDYEMVIGGVEDLKPHKLSHQTIHCRIVLVKANEREEDVFNIRTQWVSAEQLEAFAFPKPLREYLDRKQLTLHID